MAIRRKALAHAWRDRQRQDQAGESSGRSNSIAGIADALGPATAVAKVPPGSKVSEELPGDSSPPRRATVGRQSQKRRRVPEDGPAGPRKRSGGAGSVGRQDWTICAENSRARTLASRDVVKFLRVVRSKAKQLKVDDSREGIRLEVSEIRNTGLRGAELANDETAVPILRRLISEWSPDDAWPTIDGVYRMLHPEAPGRSVAAASRSRAHYPSLGPSTRQDRIAKFEAQIPAAQSSSLEASLTKSRWSPEVPRDGATTRIRKMYEYARVQITPDEASALADTWGTKEFPLMSAVYVYYCGKQFFGASLVESVTEHRALLRSVLGSEGAPGGLRD